MILPKNFIEKDIRSLLEIDWLVPRKVRHFLRTRHHVFVNGVEARFNDTVKAGDAVTLLIYASDYTIPHIKVSKNPSLIPLYETEHYIIVNKPAGIKTHPNQPDETDTLLNELASYLAPQEVYPYVVHRLDKETSGVILFAKNPFSLPILSRMMEQRAIKRLYYAKVRGIITESDFLITKKIGRHRQDRRKRVVDEHHGQHAQTHISVIERNKKQNFTLVKCELDTGRTHQIRVHLDSIHHPVINDPLYERPSNLPMMLHAKELHFIDPFTTDSIDIETDLPDYFTL